ncbi:MAG TPA: DUF3124 domain-containing protein [Spirochaetota bacterium]|nr:DUF3124 domain-containing protein [Spirochaetota bacterium]
MKKIFMLLILPVFITCGDLSGGKPGLDFFHKLNMQKITAHELSQDIPDSSIAAGEYVYVPVYSSIYYRDSSKVYNLTVTLGIRNIDTVNEIFIKEINYNNSKGENVKRFLGKPIRVRPLETFDLVIAEDDVSGGIGANFIVKWVSRSSVQSPVIEAVMISIRQGVGLSFVETGRVIKKIR